MGLIIENLITFTLAINMYIFKEILNVYAF